MLFFLSNIKVNFMQSSYFWAASVHFDSGGALHLELDFPHFISGNGQPIHIYDGRRSLPEAQRDPNLTAPPLVDEVKNPKSGTAKGEIHYFRDSDDEQPDSDEDPDDDLDI
jgi:hypothetical protein